MDILSFSHQCALKGKLIVLTLKFYLKDLSHKIDKTSLIWSNTHDSAISSLVMTLRGVAILNGS